MNETNRDNIIDLMIDIVERLGKVGLCGEAREEISELLELS